MQLPTPFNAFDYDPTQGGSVCFPLADYRVEITAAEPRVVKDNAAAGYLELSLTVTDGEARGLMQKHRLNLFNPSEVAKRIAHQELAAICFAINRPYIQDTGELLGGRFIATIGPQEDNAKYSEVKVVKCLDGSLPTKPAQGQAQAAPQGPPQQPFPGFTQAAAQAPPQAPPGFPPASAPLPQPAPPVAGASSTTSAPPWGNSVATAPPMSGGTAMTPPPWATRQ
jgi:hypothetical protein